MFLSQVWPSGALQVSPAGLQGLPATTYRHASNWPLSRPPLTPSAARSRAFGGSWEHFLPKPLGVCLRTEPVLAPFFPGAPCSAPSTRRLILCLSFRSARHHFREQYPLSSAFAPATVHHASRQPSHQASAGRRSRLTARRRQCSTVPPVGLRVGLRPTPPPAGRRLRSCGLFATSGSSPPHNIPLPRRPPFSSDDAPISPPRACCPIPLS